MASGVEARNSLTYIALAIWAALSASVHADSLVEGYKNPYNDAKVMGEKRLAAGTATSRFFSWEACIAAAELGRSDRDLLFFLSASNLSDSKPWFVSHSRANEARFCSEVLTCEQKFGNSYSDSPSNYPPC